ncbi:MAG TPA: hypothetical protein VGO40_10770 [Longimicrobium sp.]|jgi:hypothetical protein|nr:hypothetical protein [Longimicrobium sp.]
MNRLTRKQQRRLEVTGNGVRMYLAAITFVFPLLCVLYANRQYDKIPAEIPPEIPPPATYGTIVGIYMPLFAAIAAYIWATRPIRRRNAAPHGFAMALFRDLFTIVVVTVLLSIPVLMYRVDEHIQTVNTYLVWYQTIITAGAGAAFAYYFHASITPAPATAADGAPAAEADVPPAPAPARRRRRRTLRHGRSPTPER